MDIDLSEENLNRIWNDLQVRQAADDMERAIGWLVITVSPEYGSVCHIGPFESVGDAFAYASKTSKEHRAEGLPERVDVRPLFAPTTGGKR